MKNSAAKKNKKPAKKNITPLRERLDPGIIQRQASDPRTSAWVTASAGTGKTKVLIDRVLRLMLDGAKPDQILCLTFTKAAASVMTGRVRDELSAWATCTDEELAQSLTRLQGKKPAAETMRHARQLFAEFLDAPDDLRIQTIHSFAQSTLRRFPIESGIPPYFDVMDDQTAAEILRESQLDILRQIQNEPDTALAKAVRMITPETSEDDFAALIGELTYRRGQLLTVFDQHGGVDQTIDAVYKYLGAPKNADVKELNNRLNSDQGLNGFAPDIDSLKTAAAILSNGSKAEIEKEKMIRQWIDHPGQRTALFKDYESVFLTRDGDIRKRLTTKATTAAEEIMQTEALRLIEGKDFIATVNVALRTEAVLHLTDAILHKYAAKKRALNLLDYDDLVYQCHRMMSEDNAAGWILQKLPGDLKHILVDEAQDTNPDQWRLISAIANEFFNNPARKNTKDCTLFAVGDEKQSIFSFQQADPAEFNRRKKFFADLVMQSGGQWREVDMAIAFRSSPAITQAVDAVFANPDAADGLFSKDEAATGKTVRHNPFRRGQAGVVEVHPIIRAEAKEKQEPWSLPVTMEEAADPAADLADQIADQIKDWLDSGEELEARKRKINPADIMILVRRRTDFIDHMIRALKKRDIPVAGADRMSLREQIVVMDLIALGEALLFPKDDYKLACVLKSPLIGINDQQLEDLAIGRTGTLWESLQKKAGEGGIYRAAFDYLSGLQESMNNDRPYEFYSSILMNACPANQKSGVYAIFSRLGFESEDPLVEFMNAAERFEKTHTASLQGFIAWLEAGEAEVKREMSFDGDAPRVHIMTVHSAKGLEAPIVILPDTTSVPADNSRTRPKFLWPEGDRPVPLWVPRADLENRAFSREREQIELERDREFRRLLYVAMTRAEDRLYVYGYHGTDDPSEKSWHALISRGLEQNIKPEELQKIDLPLAEKNTAEKDEEKIVEKILRLQVSQTAKPKNDGVPPLPPSKAVGIPVWARQEPKGDQTSLRRFHPNEYDLANDNDIAPSPLEDEKEVYKRRLGDIVHSLLELLPTLAAEERPAAMAEYLARPVWQLRADDQQTVAGQVTDILNHPDFGVIFGSLSRPEVSISGLIDFEGKPEILSGRIDRLVIDDKSITIVDFKNSRDIPHNADTVPFQYVVQMASYRLALQQIYPDKEIKCALIYTQDAKLIPLPAEKMQAALKTLDIRPHQAAKKPARKI